jgi:hypothetical protein
VWIVFYFEALKQKRYNEVRRHYNDESQINEPMMMVMRRNKKTQDSLPIICQSKPSLFSVKLVFDEIPESWLNKWG